MDGWSYCGKEFSLKKLSLALRESLRGSARAALLSSLAPRRVHFGVAASRQRLAGLDYGRRVDGVRTLQVRQTFKHRVRPKKEERQKKRRREMEEERERERNHQKSRRSMEKNVPQSQLLQRRRPLCLIRFLTHSLFLLLVLMLFFFLFFLSASFFFVLHEDYLATSAT